MKIITFITLFFISTVVFADAITKNNVINSENNFLQTENSVNSTCAQFEFDLKDETNPEGPCCLKFSRNYL